MPEELLDGGENFEDCSYSLMNAGTPSTKLPKTIILSQVIFFGYERRHIKRNKVN